MNTIKRTFDIRYAETTDGKIIRLTDVDAAEAAFVRSQMGIEAKADKPEKLSKIADKPPGPVSAGPITLKPMFAEGQRIFWDDIIVTVVRYDNHKQGAVRTEKGEVWDPFFWLWKGKRAIPLDEDGKAMPVLMPYACPMDSRSFKNPSELKRYLKAKYPDQAEAVVAAYVAAERAVDERTKAAEKNSDKKPASPEKEKQKRSSQTIYQAYPDEIYHGWHGAGKKALPRPALPTSPPDWEKLYPRPKAVNGSVRDPETILMERGYKRIDLLRSTAKLDLMLQTGFFIESYPAYQECLRRLWRKPDNVTIITWALRTPPIKFNATMEKSEKLYHSLRIECAKHWKEDASKEGHFALNPSLLTVLGLKFDNEPLSERLLSMSGFIVEAIVAAKKREHPQRKLQDFSHDSGIVKSRLYYWIRDLLHVIPASGDLAKTNWTIT